MFKKICMALVVLSIAASFCYAQEKNKRVIKPIESSNDITPMETMVWDKIYALSGYDNEFCQSLYMWGFFDALAIFALDCRQIQELLRCYEGMNYEEVVDTVNTFYNNHPSQKSYAPGLVTSVIIPEFRKRLPFLMGEE